MAVTEYDLAVYIGEPDQTVDLSRFLASAKSKSRAAGIPDYQHNALYDQFILELAAMYYDNRGLSFSGSYQATAEANARRLVNSYVLELRHAGEDPLPDEGGDET